MTNIIIFGKSRSFESYEYIFGEQGNLSAENTHREPIVKPSRYDDSVLHYFVRDNSAWLECYIRAKGVESERDGLTFGIAVKTMSDLNLTDTVSNILMHFWDDVANVLLTEGYRFRESSIIDTLKNIQWEDEDISTIQSTTTLNQSVQQPHKQLLLLVVHNLEDINQVESVIKDYEDVYIADNSDVFKQAINDHILKKVNNQIYELLDGEIVPLTEQSQESVSDSQKKEKSFKGKIRFFPTWGKRSPDKQKYTWPQQRFNWKPIQVLLVVMGVIVVGTVIGNLCYSNHDKKENTNSESESNQGGQDKKENTNSESESNQGGQDNNYSNSVTLKPYENAIKNYLMLDCKIKSDVAITTHDLTFQVLSEKNEPSNLAHVINLNSEVKLEVKQDKRQNQNQNIIVEAYFNEHLVGKQIYTIAKKEPQQNAASIPSWKGKHRTPEEYIKDLSDALQKGKVEFVIAECEKIINDKYKGVTQKDKDSAKELHKKAKEQNNKKASEL